MDFKHLPKSSFHFSTRSPPPRLNQVRQKKKKKIDTYAASCLQDENLPFLQIQSLVSNQSALLFQLYDSQFQTPGSNQRSPTLRQEPPSSTPPGFRLWRELMRHKDPHPLILSLNVTSCWDLTANLDPNVQNLHNITAAVCWPSSHPIITVVFLARYNTVLIYYVLQLWLKENFQNTFKRNDWNYCNSPVSIKNFGLSDVYILCDKNNWSAEITKKIQLPGYYKCKMTFTDRITITFKTGYKWAAIFYFKKTPCI